MVDLGHYKLHIDHCSVSCHVLIHSRNNLWTSLLFFHEWTWKHLESCLDFWYLDWWPNFSHIASYHCFSKWTKNGPKNAQSCVTLSPPPTYTVAGQFLVLLQRIHGSAHLADWNKQTNHNSIWSAKYKWNFWQKKSKKKKLEIFENFKLGWYFGLTNQVNHHAY